MSVRRKRNLEDEDYSQPGPSQRNKKVPFKATSSQRTASDGESDYEPQDYSQSQTVLSQETLNEIINNAVIQILAHNNTLRPFKRSDILHNTKAKGRVANQVMEEVKKKLSDIYGVTLLEVEHQKYILVNPMNKKLEKYIHEQKSPKRDLLGLLLTIIFVNNMQVHEDKLRECLQKVKVDLQDNHPYFGDVNKQIQEFERQMYIVKDYVSSAKGQEKTQPFYVWGIRAKHEISMNSILEVLAKIYDTTLENLPPSLKSIAARYTEPEPMEDFA